MDIRATCDGVEGGRYGYTRGPNNEQPHWGLDLEGEVGARVAAMRGGQVVAIEPEENNGTGWGRYVVIQSAGNEGRFFLYSHLSSIDGQVQRGTTIDEGGKVGEIGRAEEAGCNKAHLHLEVREGSSTNTGWIEGEGENKTKDPEKYIGTEFNTDGEPVSDKCN
jgi:murein DD-endopeptidase MepM/ murein hydrolase activator NlpD